MDYKKLRIAYYLGIGILVLHSLIKIDVVTKYLSPIFDFELLTGFPIITIIGLLVAMGSISAFQRRFG